MNKSLEQILRYAQNGDLPAAIAGLNSVIDKDPMDYEARGNRAWLYLHSGKYDEALADYRILTKDRPDDLEAMSRLAECLMKMGIYDEAIEKASRVLSMDSKNYVAVDTWRNCVLRQGKGIPSPENEMLITQAPPRPLNPVIQMLEECDQSFPASVYPQVGQFLYSMVRCVRPVLAIETGCFVGYSTLCMGQAMEENNHGCVHSFDLFPPLGEDYQSPVVGNCQDALQVARGHVESANLAHRITFYKGDSSSSISKVFGSQENVADFAFIDGDHRYKGCIKDWHTIARLVRPGGVIVFHDTNARKSSWQGPEYVLKECLANSPDFQVIDLPTPEGFGLGIVQRVSDRLLTVRKPSFLEVLRELIELRRWKK